MHTPLPELTGEAQNLDIVAAIAGISLCPSLMRTGEIGLKEEDIHFNLISC